MVSDEERRRQRLVDAITEARSDDPQKRRQGLVKVGQVLAEARDPEEFGRHCKFLTGQTPPVMP